MKCIGEMTRLGPTITEEMPQSHSFAREILLLGGSWVTNAIWLLEKPMRGLGQKSLLLDPRHLGGHQRILGSKMNRNLATTQQVLLIWDGFDFVGGTLVKSLHFREELYIP